MPPRDCLIVQPIHPAGLERLAAAGLTPRIAPAIGEASLAAAVGDAVALITRSAPITPAIIAAGRHLRVIGVHGVGTNGVALDAAQAAGITVVNTPGTNTRSVAEHTVALALALAKDLRAADAAVRHGDFDFKYRAQLTEVAGLTFGLVGFGAIGQETARLAAALGLHPLAFGPRRTGAEFAAAGAEPAETLADLLGRADFVSLHLPLTDATRGLIDAAALAAMKPGSFLINTGRGGLVDDAALLAALDAGQIAGAGLDVFAEEPLPADHPFRAHPRLILSPHSAGSTEAALRRTALAVADRVIGALQQTSA